MLNLKNIFILKRFFIGLGVVILLFVLAANNAFVFNLAKIFLLAFIAFSLFDLWSLSFSNDLINARRLVNPNFSLNHPNLINIEVFNDLKNEFQIEVFDEPPSEFSENLISSKSLLLNPKEISAFNYHLVPTKRGLFYFDDVRIFVTSKFGFFQKCIIIPLRSEVKVYPSIPMMNKYQLGNINTEFGQIGLKKIRRLGHNYEFEQISPYIQGDDVRTINWKSTAKVGDLMVNKFNEERSQSVYAILDNSRRTMANFDNLSLLDHSINTALVISNIAMQKKDKAGLLMFGKNPGAFIKAENDRLNLKRIIDAMYQEPISLDESNFEKLYHFIKSKIKQRSLLFLFTNFDNLQAMERTLGILRLINKQHLLVVIMFEDTELKTFANTPIENPTDLYSTTFAQKFIRDKKEIIYRLKQMRIQTILTNPNELAINTINKYLELKARGLI